MGHICCFSALLVSWSGQAEGVDLRPNLHASQNLIAIWPFIFYLCLFCSSFGYRLFSRDTVFIFELMTELFICFRDFIFGFYNVHDACTGVVPCEAFETHAWCPTSTQSRWARSLKSCIMCRCLVIIIIKIHVLFEISLWTFNSLSITD